METSAARATSFIVVIAGSSRKRLRDRGMGKWDRQGSVAGGHVNVYSRRAMGDIALEQVWKVYPDGTQAVRAVDLDVPDGALMVLVGPSGCGKTTLLRMVAGLEEVTSGSIRIGEREVNDVAAKNRDIAMVFQNYALYPHMTVYENQAFGLRLRRLPRTEIDTRVREVAGVLALSDQLEKKPGQLSGGQRQRVAMGRAIVRQPQAFLMDEPLSNLDAKLRVQMRSEISRMQRDLGTTMIYVTHDQTEAMTMGTQVAVMKDGDLQQVDAPDVLYRRPANIFVAGFIGSPAMNFVQGRLAYEDGRVFAELAGLRLHVDDEAVQSRPGLARYAGRPVVVGIRPDATEDAEIAREAPADRRFTATAELRETVGSEAFVHLTLDAAPVVTEDTKALASDTGTEMLQKLEAEAARHRTPFIARMHARSRAREGEPIELVVDTRELHFFDLDTGEGIYA
jgi:multiple sugar transport system ATP-binding protein